MPRTANLSREALNADKQSLAGYLYKLRSSFDWLKPTNGTIVWKDMTAKATTDQGGRLLSPSAPSVGLDKPGKLVLAANERSTRRAPYSLTRISRWLRRRTG